MSSGVVAIVSSVAISTDYLEPSNQLVSHPSKCYGCRLGFAGSEDFMSANIDIIGHPNNHKNQQSPSSNFYVNSEQAYEGLLQ